MENLVCPLTGLLIVEPSTLPCSHIFEKVALDDFLKRNKACPVCNKIVQSKIDLSLFKKFLLLQKNCHLEL